MASCKIQESKRNARCCINCTFLGCSNIMEIAAIVGLRLIVESSFIMAKYMQNFIEKC